MAEAARRADMSERKAQTRPHFHLSNKKKRERTDDDRDRDDDVVEAGMPAKRGKFKGKR